jgi:hypothetical protein
MLKEFREWEEIETGEGEKWDGGKRRPKTVKMHYQIFKNEKAGVRR